MKLVFENLQDNKTPPKKYQNKVALCYDYGLFLSIAHKLAEDFGKVYYFTPWKNFFATSKDMSIGDGYPDIVKCYNFWDVVDEVDLFVFPDILDGDLQERLRSMGKSVWGSGRGEDIEVKRWEFLQLLKSLGLNTPPSILIEGIENLATHLQIVTNKFVKFDGESRGDNETFFHKDWNTTRPLIDKLRYDLGPITDCSYIVQDPIEGELEYGFDTWMVNGEFPETIMYGFEIKDLGYVCKVLPFKDMPKEILEVFDKMRIVFQKYKYTGCFSAELRVDKQGKFYFMDPCCRNPNPATYCMMNMIENFSEIIYEGARGNGTIRPLWKAKYGAEITINSEFIKKNFGNLTYDASLKPFINRMNSFMDKKGCEWSIPNGVIDSYGSVVSISSDPKQMMDTLLKRIEGISGHHVEINTKNIDLALEKLMEGEQFKQIKFKGMTLQRFDDELNYYPDCHPNCQCFVENGEWTFGESETGPCDYCIEESQNFAMGQGRGFKKN
jgi:hypothetical protein